MRSTDLYRIGIVVYDGVDLLDVAVPHELFDWTARIEPDVNPDAPRRETHLISLDGPSITTRDRVTLGGDLPSFRDCEHIDLLWVPGGEPAELQRLMLDSARMDFLARQAASADYAASVCEGALLAAAAGYLDGYKATTHWAFRSCLALFPRIDVVPGYPRYVVDRTRITGGGISSGLDEALQIIALLSGELVARKVQLSIQYNPIPPFSDGDPSVARPPVLAPGEGGTCAFPGMAQTIARVLAERLGHR
ncbi:transcriptional regulator [Burkholderia sp. MSMB617WGS]|uniref:DJ-1/PfpI family protein n=1 Tax=Burkholderia sp. MSMB617WGS TaxID=1637831 RepID=UPI00075FE596|nr:DJ-1/PfpI family protein [Burkholderia sp. MSMB617WGS]AOK49462.1 transcriptional regulator [Burkholderia sp. MSMB617WGS]